MEGNYIVETLILGSPTGENEFWQSRMAGFIAPSSQKEAAAKVLEHMILTTRYDPSWQKMQQEAYDASSGAAMKTSAMYSEYSNQFYESAQQALDDSMRRTSNMINDQKDVYDPNTLQAWKADYGAKNCWMCGDRMICGFYNQPSPECIPLQDLP
jgi:hypothetical protein